MNIENNKTMITDIDKFLSTNQVIPKSIKLRFEVEKRLLALPNHKDRNEKIIPHQRLTILEKRLDEIGKKIESQEAIIKDAAIDSLNEFEICKRIDDFLTPDEKERSFNNQLNWEECFVTNYAISFALEDIDKFNDCVNNPSGSLYNDIVNQLVSTIELIGEYYDLIEKIEVIKAPKEIEDLKKIIDSKNEEIKYKEFKITALMKILKNKQKEQITGLKSSLTKEQAIKLYSRLRGEYIATETLETNFVAIFSTEPLPENFIPVEWIKKQKKNKKSLNKRAVFDLLNLTEVDMNNIDLPTINRLICGSLTHSNWNGNKGLNPISEAYPDLETIISNL